MPSMTANSPFQYRSMTEPHEPTYFAFSEHPESDSCWSLSAGPDGRIYASACAEGPAGGIAKLVRYREEDDQLEYLLDMDVAVDDPPDSGRLTQCKIHYSLCPSAHDGILYLP